MSKPRIGLLSMGGTIMGTVSSRLDFTAYKAGEKPLGAFLEVIPEAAEIAEIDAQTMAAASSREVRTDQLVMLSGHIEKMLESEGYDGIVVLHGTNTLEETAYFLHLTVHSKKPLVVLGAQRPSGTMSNDAELNTINALRVASSPQAAGIGTLVVLDSRIHSARDVTKTNTYALNTFQSPNSGPIGEITADGQVKIYYHPVRRHTWQSELHPIAGRTMPRVEVIYSTLGGDGMLVDAAVQAGARGIVIAGAGAGLANMWEQEALLRAWEQGVAVVRSSRVGSGSVLPVAKGGPFIAAHNLNPQKARILLMIGLALGQSREQVEALFEQY
jgi:L-asparaginase